MSWSCKLQQVPEQQKSILLLGFIGFLTIKTKSKLVGLKQF
jgi:hypothetical protein